MSNYFLNSDVTLVCAHRGHSVDGHENSVLALEQAATHGADACEVDLRILADGVFVVLHDPLLSRTTSGRGAVSATAWPAVSKLQLRHASGNLLDETVPSLSMILEAASSLNMNLVLEIKDDLDTPSLKALLRIVRDKYDLSKVIFSSFNHFVLRRLSEIEPQTVRKAIVTAQLIDPIKLVRSIPAHGITLDYPFSAFHANEEIAAAGIQTSHFISPNSSYAEAGELGGQELQALSRSVANKNLAMVYCDDAREGRALVDRSVKG
ncbi:MAG: glycerophosphodiester phosphodiesterase family protein [Pseudomonadota bacterium]